MRTADLARFTTTALTAHPLRTVLSALGIAVGIAAVILLTAIGEGLNRFVIGEFTQFGTQLIGIQPGKNQTHGGSLGGINTTRPLTVEDAAALARVPGVRLTDPLVQGNAEVRHAGRTRRVTLYGVGGNFAAALQMRVASGRFLPGDDPRAARPLVVLGARTAQELFGSTPPLGAHLHVGTERFVVIGVMAAKGQVLGFDLDDTVFIPVGRALDMFNREGLMEIHVVHEPGAPLDTVVSGLRSTLAARHGGEDFTITPQQQMLDVFSGVLDTLTFAVAAIGGISLLVGGVGILTILTIAVSERTAEIGLLRALGSTRRRVLALFLAEAALLAALGGLAGLALGAGGAALLSLALPALPVSIPWSYALIAEAVAVAVGLAAGVAPALRAARLDPIEALRSE